MLLPKSGLVQSLPYRLVPVPMLGLLAMLVVTVVLKLGAPPPHHPAYSLARPSPSIMKTLG